MAVICEKYGFIYIQVPGTGCSVISEVLREKFEGKDLGRKHNDIPEIVAEGLLSEEELQKYIIVANVRNPFDRIVTYYQRLNGHWIEKYISWAQRDLDRQYNRDNFPPEIYKKKNRKLEKEASRKRRRARVIKFLGFNTWLQMTVIRWHVLTDSRTVTSDKYLFPMLEGVDIALKQENLEGAFNEFLFFLGVEDKVLLPRKNLTDEKKPYTSYYNQLSQWFFEKLYRDKLQYFGYRYGGIVGDDSIVHLTKRLKQKTGQ